MGSKNYSLTREKLVNFTLNKNIPWMTGSLSVFLFMSIFYNRHFNLWVVGIFSIVDEITVSSWRWVLSRFNTPSCMFYEWSWCPWECLSRLVVWLAVWLWLLSVFAAVFCCHAAGGLLLCGCQQLCLMVPSVFGSFLCLSYL